MLLSSSALSNSHMLLSRRLYPLKPTLWSLVLILCLSATCPFARGQAGPKPSENPAPSRFDLYGGYGDIQPFGSTLSGHTFQSVHNMNATISVAGYFWKNLGVQVEGGYFNGPSPRGIFYQCAPACESRDPMYYSAEGGPIVRFPKGRLIPFVHVLGGGARINGPYLQPLMWGYGVTAGGGADYVLPVLSNHLALRVQPDYQYFHADYGTLAPNKQTGGIASVDAFKVSAGVVVRLGSQTPTTPVALACSVQPATVFPGESVSVSGTASTLNGKSAPAYRWETTGGQIAPSGALATVATKNLQPGSYVVTGHVSEGSRPYEQASCTAGFSVKAYEPPTLSCAATPTSLQAGDTATITSSGASPQNRALSYSYSTSAGQLTGSGATTMLATAGVAPGAITVTCNVVDDLGQSARATTSVLVQAQASLPEKPQPRRLCSVAFDRDTKRPMRVNNEAKACLDDIALEMQRSSDAKLVIIGSHAADEPADFAAVRSLNVRSYLSHEKRIDDARMELRIEGDGGRNVINVLLVPGAELQEPGSVSVDASTITQKGQAYGVPHRKKK